MHLTRRSITGLTVAGLVFGCQPLAAQSTGRPIDNLAIPASAPRIAPGTFGHVEIAGRGPVPLILIPGAPFGWEVWRGFMARNADRYTMYAVTLPGYGGTPLSASGASDDIEQRAWSNGVVTAVERLIETRSLDRPVIVANHLMAAYYAVRAAAAMQCRIGGVIALASDPISGDPLRFATPRTREERASGLRQRWIPYFQTVDSATWSRGAYRPSMLSRDSIRAARLFQQQISTPLYVQVRYYLEYLSDDLSPQLTSMRVPMLSAVQRFDISILPDSLVQRLATRWGSAAAAEDSLTRQGFWRTRFGLDVPALATRFLTTRAGVMMDDEPSVVDALVAEFVSQRRGCR